MIEVNENCLCGSEVSYSLCCQSFHQHKQRPPTAECLMRSRFTAYAMHNARYLLETWDSATRPKEIDFSNDNAKWTKLEIVKTKKGGRKDSKGLVEFKAYYTLDGEKHIMSEISRFQKKSGQWQYLDGKVKGISKESLSENQGKNAPCSCGSGKKFKRCCGK